MPKHQAKKGLQAVLVLLTMMDPLAPAEIYGGNAFDFDGRKPPASAEMALVPLGDHHRMSPLQNCQPTQPQTAGIVLRLNREQVGDGLSLNKLVRPRQRDLKPTRTRTPSCCVEMLLQDANTALGSELLTSTR